MYYIAKNKYDDITIATMNYLNYIIERDRHRYLSIFYFQRQQLEIYLRGGIYNVSTLNSSYFQITIISCRKKERIDNHHICEISVTTSDYIHIEKEDPNNKKTVGR